VYETLATPRLKRCSLAIASYRIRSRDQSLVITCRMLPLNPHEMAQTPFSSLNLFPSPSNIPAPTQRHLSPFSIQQPNYASSSGLPRSRANSTAFRQLAHKSAHHLHSIPPREKSTRSLIIDYILWVHGRTRFAQARAELGMTDRTGGPSSKNFSHRFRPENFEEEEEQPSDGERFTVLQGERESLSDPRGADEDRIRRPDLTLAKALKQRSESLEKVVASILDQPPVVHPRQEDDLAGSQPSRLHPISSHPPTLPNGVRLRLALGTVINDVFARQNPPLSPRQQEPRNSPPILRPSDSPLLSNTMILSDPSTLTLQFSPLPPCLIPLSSVSGAFIAGARSLSFSDVSSIGGSIFPHVCSFCISIVLGYSLITSKADCPNLSSPRTICHWCISVSFFVFASSSSSGSSLSTPLTSWM
jgi:hypothetical protein